MTTTLNDTFTPPEPSNLNQNPNATTASRLNATVSSDEEAAFRHVRRIRNFYARLAIYVVVITGLAIFNFIKSPNHIWVIWPALGWGLGLVFYGMRVFGSIPFMNADWEKRQVEKYLGRKL